MSTKISISHDEQHHLFQEMFDNELIHIQFKNPTEFSTETDKYGSRVKISVPLEVWERLVEGWLKNKCLFDKDEI